MPPQPPPTPDSPPPPRQPGGLRLFRQGFAYAFAQVLLRAGTFLLVPLFTSILLPEEYGLVGVLAQFAQVAAVLALCGQQAALTRLAIDVERDPVQLAEVVGTQARWVLGTGLTSMLLLAVCWPILRGLVDDQPFFPLGAAVVLGIAGNSSFQLGLSWLQLQGKAKEHAFLSLERWGVMVLASLLFVLGFGWGAAGILLAQSLGWWAGAWRGRRHQPDPLPSIDLTVLKKSLSYGLPILPHALAGVAVLTTDRALVAAHSGLAAAGVYTLGVNLSSAVFVIAQGMQGAWVPFFLREDRDREHHGYERVRRLSFFVLLGIALLATGVGLFGREILLLIAPPSYAESAGVLPSLCFANFVRGFYLMFAAVILAEPRSARWIAVVTVPSALLNLGLNSLLVPGMGMDGAMVSAVASHGLAAILSGILARMARPVPFQYLRGFILLLGVGLTLWVGRELGFLARILVFLGFAGFVFALDSSDILFSARPLASRLRARFGPDHAEK